METEKIVFKKKRYKIKVFDIINIFILTLFALLCLYPFFNQLMISFATKQDFYAADLFVWPKHFNFDSYKFILYQDRIGYAFLVSLFVTVVGTAYNMALTILGAYVLTKFRGRAHPVLSDHQGDRADRQHFQRHSSFRHQLVQHDHTPQLFQSGAREHGRVVQARRGGRIHHSDQIHSPPFQGGACDDRALLCSGTLE